MNSLSTRSDQGDPTQLSQCRRLAQVLTLTRDMLKHGKSGDWERVIELEAERRTDLALCFEDAEAYRESDLVAEAIAALLHINEELMALLKEARASVLQLGIEQTRKRSAIGNYHAVQQAG